MTHPTKIFGQTAVDLALVLHGEEAAVWDEKAGRAVKADVARLEIQQGSLPGRYYFDYVPEAAIGHLLSVIEAHQSVTDEVEAEREAYSDERAAHIRKSATYIFTALFCLLENPEDGLICTLREMAIEQALALDTEITNRLLGKPGEAQ